MVEWARLERFEESRGGPAEVKGRGGVRRVLKWAAIQPDVVGRPLLRHLNGAYRFSFPTEMQSHLPHILDPYFKCHNEDRTHMGLDRETPMGRPTSNRSSLSSKLVEHPSVGAIRHRCEWSEAA
jgi:hypothetical protein